VVVMTITSRSSYPPPPPPHPPTSAVKPPTDINDFNAHSDYYRSDAWGLDSIPTATFQKNKEDKDKTVHWFAEWKLFKDKPIPPEKIQEFKTHPSHSYNKLKGLGLIVGIVKYGPNKGKWINFFDGDNEKGQEVILKILCYDSIDNLKQDCVVEFHPSSPNKFHVYVLSDVPFNNFGGLTTDRENVKKNIIPGLEIKGRGSGLAYCAPSLYDGPIEDERYQLVEGSAPAPRRIFDEFEVSECEKRLEEICQLYGVTSLDDNGKSPMSELLRPDFVVTEGNNRKNHVLRVGMHYLKEDEKTAEEKTKLWNQEHCDPPLSHDIYREFPSAWEWANKYHERNKEKNTSNNNTKEDTKETKRQKTINLATKIIEEQNVSWFHDEYQTAYMRIKIDNHFEIYRVVKKDRKFRLFLTKLYYDQTGDIIKDEDLNEVIRRLEGNGIFSGNLKKIHLRKCWNVEGIDEVTGHEDVDRNICFYDMCSPNWTCIVVDGYNDRWDLLPFHPEHIIFYRYQQLPQAIPNRDYKADIFEQWLDTMHIKNENDRLLVKVWFIASYLSDQPHPMLIPHGPPGGAKSTFCKQLQIIIDPYAGEPLILPKDKNELAQHAHHRALLIYDNVEYEIPKWLSDLLCQLITSANVSKRQLYTDDTDFAYVLMRSIVLNGLQIPKLKADALDRTIVIHFERISDEERKNQTEIDDWFRSKIPDILGKTFDVLARSLRIYMNMQELKRKPRMADFASRGASIARAFAELENKDPDEMEKKFLDAYDDVMERQNIDIVESNSVASALIRWHDEMLTQGREGDLSVKYTKEGKIGFAPGELLHDLTIRAEQMGFDVKDKEWPKKPNQFTRELRPLTPDIRHGYRIDIHIFRDTKGDHTTKNSTWIEISQVQNGHIEKTGIDDNSDDGDEGTDKSSSKKTKVLSKVSPPSPPSPPSQNSRSKTDKNGGDTPYPSPPPSLPKTTEIELEINLGGGGGGGGGGLAKNILFSQEDSSSLHQSLIDDIKHSAIAVDPEWDNRPNMDDRLLQFNFYDSQGKNWVINVNRDCNGSEALLLDKVENTIRNYNVVLTYFERGNDMGFSKWNKRALFLGKVSPISIGKRKDGKDAHINMLNHKGQPIKDIDLGLVHEMPIIENFLQNCYLSNELDEVARALINDGKLDGMSGELFVELPLDKQVAYGMKDAELTFKLAGARNYAVLSVLEKTGQMFIGGSFTDLTMMCSTGPTQWWSALFKNKFNATPSPTAIKRKGEEGELKGGHVEDINEIKEYRNVVIFDFRGQYPSIISRYNICLTTACCSCCENDSMAKVNTGLPDVDDSGWWFCRKKRGILPQIIDELVTLRDDYKTKMKAAKKAGNTELAQQYDIMQNSCKLLSNSLYGVFGEPNFEFGDLRIANTITGFGRYKVIKMGQMIEQDYPGLKSVYHDTDSTFIVGLEPTELQPMLDENDATIKDIITKISAPEAKGGLGLPLEYKKCYKKVMIKASKNYMGLNAATNEIETVGLVGKKRNQCKFVKQAFEQHRQYWKDDVSNDIVGDHIKQIITRLDAGAVPLELLQEKNTIKKDPWTGYSPKAQLHPSCVLGRKYNRRIGESTPRYYLAKQEKVGDPWFTEDPTQIDYNKYKERLRTALEGILTVRGYDKEQIDSMLGLTKPQKIKKKRLSSKRKIGQKVLIE
jgi:DNA polymerase elongation subunit (family B)